MNWRTIIIGLGRIGIGYDFDITNHEIVYSHAKSFSAHPDFELVGGVDPDPKACARFAGRYGSWTGSDLVECLETLKPQVVVISSPTKYHAESLRLVLRYAKPLLILCEKPLSYSLKEAESMVADCHAAGCKLYVNYVRRVEPGVLEIKRRLQSGDIVTPLKGVLWYTKGLLHSGSHFSNLLEFWLGPMEKFSIINPGRPFGESDFEPDVQVTFAAGEVCFLAAREEHFSHYEIQLIAPNGCLRYEQGGEKILWQTVGQHLDSLECSLLSLPGERITTESSRLQWEVAQHVSACLRGQPSGLCSGEDALRTLESLLKIKAAL